MTFKTLAQNVAVRNAQTPQTQPAPNASVPQVKNNAGGYVFELDPMKKLDRFLIIGSTSNTMYQAASDLTKLNVDNVIALIKSNGKAVVGRVVEISQAGRAKNNDYALLVMALVFAHGSDEVKQYAKASLNFVARTGTHLLHFAAFSNSLRGWGRSLKSAIDQWYTSKSNDNLAYQVVKYKSRDGWSHRDVLRLTHLKAGEDKVRNNLYKFIVKGPEGLEQGDVVPQLLVAVEKAKTASKAELVKLITDHRLSHEMIPTEMKNEADVWAALLPHMGMTAMIRNLNKLTQVGLIKPLSQTSKFVIEQLNNVELLKKDRIHPIQALIAQKIYSAGKGDKGSLVWTPDSNITKALEDCFYHAFQTVEPSGKNHYLGIDVSGSMHWESSRCTGAPQLTSAEAATVMAMVTVRTEPWTYVAGFNTGMVDLKVNANDTLKSAMHKMNSVGFGGTNCAAPMQDALQRKLDVDTFVVYTDNDTYAGRGHPFQELQRYRKEMNKPEAKMVVCAFASHGFTIADPNDAGMLDVVGFDSATPKFISEFSAGRI